MAKTQTIVLRHVYLLLGYNQNERGFYVPPYRLRYEHMVNAVLFLCVQFKHHTIKACGEMEVQFCVFLKLDTRLKWVASFTSVSNAKV
jgi:hypothetical protein